MKRIHVLYVFSVVFCVLLLGLPELFSRAVWSRSFFSTLAELILKRDRKSYTAAQAEEELQAATALGRTPCRLPQEIKFRVTVEEFSLDGMQIYVMNGKGKNGVFLYLHGGAYVRPPVPFHWSFWDNVAALTDCKVVIPIYPRAPFDDFRRCYDVLSRLYERVAEREKEISVGGDSSGGGLALGLCLRRKEEGLSLPQRLILLAPWVDLTMTNPLIPKYERVDPRNKAEFAQAWANAWANGTDLKDERLSPIYGDLSGLCEVNIFAGTRDLLYPDCVRLHERLTESGVKSALVTGKGLNHVYPVYPTPEGRKAVKQIAKLLSGGKTLPFDGGIEGERSVLRAEEELTVERIG